MTPTILWQLVARRVGWFSLGLGDLPPVRVPGESTAFGSVAVPPFILLGAWRPGEGPAGGEVSHRPRHARRRRCSRSSPEPPEVGSRRGVRAQGDLHPRRRPARGG